MEFSLSTFLKPQITFNLSLLHKKAKQTFFIPAFQGFSEQLSRIFIIENLINDSL